MTNISEFHVLIVEDTTDIANLLMISLEQIGLNPFIARNGQVAMEYLDHHQPDLILLDLNLPVVNGWRVLEYAKKQYGEHTIHVIVTTGNTDEVNRLVGKMQYVSSYVQKPFSPDDVVQLVRELLELDKL